MPDEKLTAQDLIYAAKALRQAAVASEKQAQDPAFISSRDIFESAAKGEREVAAKFERLAKRMR
jgi:hypothetical protein